MHLPVSDVYLLSFHCRFQCKFTGYAHPAIMKRFSTILKYLSDQKGYVALYFILNLLSVLFSLVSLTMLVPFLQLLFGNEKLLIKCHG